MLSLQPICSRKACRALRLFPIPLAMEPFSSSFSPAGQGTVKLGRAWASEISLYPGMSDSQPHLLLLQVWFGFAYCFLGEAEGQEETR